MTIYVVSNYKNEHSNIYQYWSMNPVHASLLESLIQLNHRHLWGRGTDTTHWGNRTMVVAATIVIMAAVKKAQQNVFALCHSYNPHNTWKIFGAYAQLDCITTSIVGNVGNKHSMQVIHSQKGHPQVKTNIWIIWHHKLNSFHNHKAQSPQFDPFHVERRLC